MLSGKTHTHTHTLEHENDVLGKEYKNELKASTGLRLFQRVFDPRINFLNYTQNRFSFGEGLPGSLAFSVFLPTPTMAYFLGSSQGTTGSGSEEKALWGISWAIGAFPVLEGCVGLLDRSDQCVWSRVLLRHSGHFAVAVEHERNILFCSTAQVFFPQPEASDTSFANRQNKSNQ